MREVQRRSAYVARPIRTPPCRLTEAVNDLLNQPRINRLSVPLTLDLLEHRVCDTILCLRLSEHIVAPLDEGELSGWRAPSQLSIVQAAGDEEARGKLTV